MTDIISTAKFVLTSPKKLREVAYLVRKYSLSDAIERLPFVNKRAALPLLKAIKTARGNAIQAGFSDKEITIKEIQINEGPRLKRFRAGSRGRAKPYKKAMSHIRIVLEAIKQKSEKTLEKEALDDSSGKSREVAAGGISQKKGLKLPTFLQRKKKSKN